MKKNMIKKNKIILYLSISRNNTSPQQYLASLRQAGMGRLQQEVLLSAWFGGFLEAFIPCECQTKNQELLKYIMDVS